MRSQGQSRPALPLPDRSWSAMSGHSDLGRRTSRFDPSRSLSFAFGTLFRPLLGHSARIRNGSSCPKSRQSQALGLRGMPGRAAIVDPYLCYSLLMRQPVLRPAHPRDFPFCERLYFTEMDHIISQLGLDMARQRESFARQWHVAEVRIITMSGEDIGWLQTKTTDSTPFLGQLYLSGHKQRQGIGTRVLQMPQQYAGTRPRAAPRTR